MPNAFGKNSQGLVSNNGSFVLNDIKAEDAGIYVCEASNDVGNAIYKNFSISVEGKSVINVLCFWSNIVRILSINHALKKRILQFIVCNMYYWKSFFFNNTFL